MKPEDMRNTRPLAHAPIVPTRLLTQGMPYTPSHSTDIQETWKRFGWMPAKPTAPHTRTRAHVPLVIDLIETEAGVTK